MSDNSSFSSDDEQKQLSYMSKENERFEKKRLAREEKKRMREEARDKKRFENMFISELRTYQGPWQEFKLTSRKEMRQNALAIKRKPSKARVNSQNDDEEDRKWMVLEPESMSCRLIFAETPQKAAIKVFKELSTIDYRQTSDWYGKTYQIQLIQKKPGRNIYDDKVHIYSIKWRKVDNSNNEFARKYHMEKSTHVKSLGVTKLDRPFDMYAFHEQCKRDDWFEDDKDEDELERELISEQVGKKPVKPERPEFIPGVNADSEDVLAKPATTPEEKERRRLNEENQKKAFEEYEKELKIYEQKLAEWEKKNKDASEEAPPKEKKKRVIKRKQSTKKAAAPVVVDSDSSSSFDSNESASE